MFRILLLLSVSSYSFRLGYRLNQIRTRINGDLLQGDYDNEVAPVYDPSVTPLEINDELKSSFMSYAMSTILSRALPDARDGLKPVHRRLLYAMSLLNLTPDSSHRKCARIVGEVLGKFHPHGDQSVYAALVRVAQDFILSHPLIDGHGNFGSIDDDPPAAMRYTEAKLSALAYETLLADIKEDTVDFIPNFDGNENEPVILPAKLPMLLLNGASGIAVGMATSIPPHNLGELATAMVALLDNPSLSLQDLIAIIPGPDFPTGGQILGLQGANEMYQTGHGSVVMRAKCHIEQITSISKSGFRLTRNAIIVTELPYMTNKAGLLEKIADMVNEKKLDGISDLRDESDRDGIRMVLELKRDATPEVVLNNLYKKTSLQTAFPGNIVALVSNGRQPQRINLKQALEIFINFRFETIRRRSAYQLDKVKTRLHIVQGLLLALSKIDKIIDLIRTSKDEKSVKAALSSDLYGLTVTQADAILALRLGRLTSLEEGKLKEEELTLLASKQTLEALLVDDAQVKAVMRSETLDLKAKYAIPRRSEIVKDQGNFEDQDFVPNARSVVLLTRSGYIKRIPILEFDTQSRGGKGKASISPASVRNDASESPMGPRDSVIQFFSCNDHDSILFITERGVAYSLKAFQIPQASRTARGTPIPQVIPVSNQEKVTSMIPVDSFAALPTQEDSVVEEVDTLVDVTDDDVINAEVTEDDVSGEDNTGDSLVLLTAKGIIKRTPLKAFANISARGLIIISLMDGDSLQWARRCRRSDKILIATCDGYASMFPASMVPSTGRNSRGVRALKLREGDRMADMDIVSSKPLSKDGSEAKPQYVLAVTKQGFGKRLDVSKLRLQRRGGMGTVVIKFKNLFPNRKSVRAAGISDDGCDALTCMRVCTEDEEAILSTKRGTVLRQPIDKVSVQSRTATGFILQRIEDDDCVIMVDIVPPESENIIKARSDAEMQERLSPADMK